jgi:hypothetical protein
VKVRILPAALEDLDRGDFIPGKEERSVIIFSTRSLPISALWSFTPAFT